MNSSDLQQIELNIKQAQKIVDLGEALERLRGNRDFKKVIIEGFFEQEAIRLIHLKADPDMQTDERQKSILLQMDAIGALNQYFQTIILRASMASKAIVSDEQMRDELLEEGV